MQNEQKIEIDNHKQVFFLSPLIESQRNVTFNEMMAWWLANGAIEIWKLNKNGEKQIMGKFSPRKKKAKQ